jgi:hypothetical protein
MAVDGRVHRRGGPELRVAERVVEMAIRIDQRLRRRHRDRGIRGAWRMILILLIGPPAAPPYIATPGRLPVDLAVEVPHPQVPPADHQRDGGDQQSVPGEATLG